MSYKGSYKQIDSYIWVNVSDKHILIIGKNWNGKPNFACKIDILLIPKSLKSKFKDSFSSESLKDCKVIYI